MALYYFFIALTLSNFCFQSVGMEAAAHSLSNKLLLAKDGKSAEVSVTEEFTLKLFLGESFAENATEFRIDSNFIEVDYSNTASLRIDFLTQNNVDFFKFQWKLPPVELEYLKDTIYLADSQWYGGALTQMQGWPLDIVNEVYPMTPHILFDLFKSPISGQERYWLNANKVALFVLDHVPLWTERDKAYLKFQAQVVRSPYANFEYTYPNFLEYEIAVAKQSTNVSLRDFHLTCFQRYLNAPNAIPDQKLIEKPIWSTWAQFKSKVTEENVLQFIDKIVENDFPISQLELDDKWTSEYGDFEIDTTKFPDFKKMVEKLQKHDVRLSAWVHPFVNVESKNGKVDSLKKFFVQSNQSGVVEARVLSWWNGNGYSVDFTNPEAAEWYNTQLRDLQAEYKIFTYKFDGGEVSFLPNNFQLFNGKTPDDFARAYTRNTVSKFGNAVENRMGSGTQDSSVFLRMFDRVSDWSNMGLQTIIPTVLVLSLHGYFWVLSDMIGGNGFKHNLDSLDLKETELPSKELYIRWIQVNCFLQAVQFSIGPWNFDNETMQITKKFLSLREEWTYYIISECQSSVETKHPVVRPMWWISDAPEALNSTDQFLVGDELLVAPIVEEGVYSRNVFLPSGRWRCGNTDEEFTGPLTIKAKAPLDTLPYYIQIGSKSANYVYYIFGGGLVAITLGMGIFTLAFKRK